MLVSVCTFLRLNSGIFCHEFRNVLILFSLSAMFGIQGLSLDIDLLMSIQWLACQTEYTVQGASDHVYNFFLSVLSSHVQNSCS